MDITAKYLLALSMSYCTDTLDTYRKYNMTFTNANPASESFNLTDELTSVYPSVQNCTDLHVFSQRHMCDVRKDNVHDF